MVNTCGQALAGGYAVGGGFVVDYSLVLDEDERQKMLDDGYAPEVIDWTAKQRYNAALAEFRAKNACLKRYFEPLPYFDFMEDLFPGVEQFMVVTTDRQDGEKGCQLMDVDQLMDYQAFRSDVCVPPATFINGRYSLACCKDIHALVIDLDAVEADVLDVVISNGSIGRNIPLPTYIVNSGYGVHLYYAFQRPVPYYHCNRKQLKEMYDRICFFTKKGIAAKTDKHAITQPFRMPGAQTKIGQTATAWKSGDKWSVAMLGRRLGVDVSEMDLVPRPLLPQREYHEARMKWQEQQLEDEPKKTKKKREWRSPLDGNEGFYRSCLRRCYEETEEGHRQKSMFAMAIVAYKVRTIDKKTVEADLMDLMQHYNSIGKRMKPSELKKAMGGFSIKYDRTSSQKLEEYFGWEFRRIGQYLNREPQPQKWHLEDARAKKARMKERGQAFKNPEGRPKGACTKEQIVLNWRLEHPEGKPKDCIQATGISKNTVYKWWKTVEVEDHE